MRVTAIYYLREYAVRLTFSDGYAAEIDLSPALAENDPLRDPEKFHQGAPNGLTIEWPGGIDFCPDVLRLWCEKGHVLTMEETDSLLAIPLPFHMAA